MGMFDVCNFTDEEKQLWETQKEAIKAKWEFTLVPILDWGWDCWATQKEHRIVMGGATRKDALKATIRQILIGEFS